MMATTTAETVAVRDATDDDMAAVQAIYAHHVLHGLASFEIEPPDRTEMMKRRQAIVERGLPYLVATVNGRVAGYAYAGPYRLRPAYRFMLEDSVYVAPDALGHGLGRRLLADLIERCAALGYRQMIAVIGDSQNRPSIGLHERLGFARIGAIRSAGFKFGRWVDSVLMQRTLGEGDSTLPPPGR
jgi:phosphinothricin acetyltransferase